MWPNVKKYLPLFSKRYSPISFQAQWWNQRHSSHLWNSSEKKKQRQVSWGCWDQLQTKILQEINCSFNMCLNFRLSANLSSQVSTLSFLKLCLHSILLKCFQVKRSNGGIHIYLRIWNCIFLTPEVIRCFNYILCRVLCPISQVWLVVSQAVLLEIVDKKL